MTEEQWLASSDSGPMLTFLRGKISERKLRLFAAACCRDAWHLLCDQRSRQALELAEHVADKKAFKKELTPTRREAWAAHLAIHADGQQQLTCRNSAAGFAS
ncbi:MAG: hypothetical protein AB7K24_18050 [Gemmataceae bacterium]